MKTSVFTVLLAAGGLTGSVTLQAQQLEEVLVTADQDPDRWADETCAGLYLWPGDFRCRPWVEGATSVQHHLWIERLPALRCAFTDKSWTGNLAFDPPSIFARKYCCGSYGEKG